MSQEKIKKAYDEDLRKYGYVRQSTINSFALQQEYQEPTIRKSRKGKTYLQKIHDDISEYGFITNDTVNTIIGYIPEKPSKKIRKRKRMSKIRSEQTKRGCYDSYVYHRIFERHYGSIDHCMICGSQDKLQIHHKDKNHKNNDISNLIMLCYKCHCLAHKGDKVYRLMIKQNQ